MFSLNSSLKAYAVDALGVSAEASDEDLQKALSAAIANGDLTGEKLTELLKQEVV